MTPRNPAHIGPGGRGFFGTVTVGTRGQISIPAQARKSLGLEPGASWSYSPTPPKDSP